MVNLFGSRSRCGGVTYWSAAMLMLVLGVSGCGGGSGNSTPSPAIVGKWATPTTIPGSGTTLTLNETNGSVSGTGAYLVEAGQPGTITVAGSSAQPFFNLTFQYSTGAYATYVGSFKDSNHMVGTATQAGTSYALDFTRE